MNSLKVPDSGLLLEGPSHGESAAPKQAFSLSLPDEVVQKLAQSALNGDDISISLGRNPTLHFGSRSHKISNPSDDAPYEVYLTRPFESTRRAERLPHTGSLFRKFSRMAQTSGKTQVEASAKETGSKAKLASSSSKSSVSSTLNSDIEALQNGLAAHDAARERARVIEKPPVTSKTNAAKTRSKLWSNNHGSTPKPKNVSPAVNAVPSPPTVPSLSASQQVMERKKEQRVVLVHELAVRERSTDYLRGKWTGKEDDFQPALEKMADFSSETKKWAMKKACWKELDVWKYDYKSQEERQMVIENAIRQYDKQRLSSSEAEWQRLLPKEERGKGRCLSRLQANLARGPAQPAPKVKTQRTDDSSESKDDADSLESNKSKAAPEPAPRAGPQAAPPKTKKVNAQEAQAKRLLNKTKPRSATVAAAPQKQTTAKSRAGGTKGNGGRVLSAAIIENSDSSGDEALMQKSKEPPPKSEDTVVVRTKPSGPESGKRQPVKRSREDGDSSSSSGTPLSKRIKSKQPLPAASVTQAAPANAGPLPRRAAAPSSYKPKSTSPTKSSPLASSPPTNASDLEETPPATKKRKAEDEGKSTVPSKRRAAESVPTDVMTKAHKFKAFYQKYEALHYEISALDNPPHEKLADLLDMRGRLQIMKQEIYKQYSPDRL